MAFRQRGAAASTRALALCALAAAALHGLGGLFHPQELRPSNNAGQAFAMYATRPKNAYMFFAADMRSKYAKPGVSASEVAKALGAEWKTLKAPARKKYEAEAAKDKERYQEELAAMG
mmetsp:Transcript_38561/g.119988  ORF Transcript_38561/g.119988 Transcript_38561/m.119988 type:complete len:118 (-) Transcript_38561:62-415(-)